jgi:hypothetical protein
LSIAGGELEALPALQLQFIERHACPEAGSGQMQLHETAILG